MNESKPESFFNIFLNKQTPPYNINAYIYKNNPNFIFAGFVKAFIIFEGLYIINFFKINKLKYFLADYNKK